MIYEFEVVGTIEGKARPRLDVYTGRIYTPQNTRSYEELIRQYFKIKYPRYQTLEGRVAVKIIAYFKPAKNTTKKNRELMLSGALTPIKKPDIDNIGKVMLDALNKIAFKDDNQVTKMEIEKVYAEEEKIYIKIEEY